MTVTVGDIRFDHVSYDRLGDVLYLRRGTPDPHAPAQATPEGHAVRYDDQGEVLALTIVNARWLQDRDGYITVSAPRCISAERNGDAIGRFDTSAAFAGVG